MTTAASRFKSPGFDCKSAAVSTIRAVSLAFNQSASVADEPPSRDGFSVELFVAGDIGTFFLFASGILVPSIMVSTAVHQRNFQSRERQGPVVV